MRKIYFFVVIILMTNITEGQIIAWHFKEASGQEIAYDPTINNIGLQTSALERGSGINFSSFGRAFSSNNFTVNGTKADALVNNDYISFTIKVQQGFSVSLHTLDSKLKRSVDGPTAYRWYFCVNGVDYLPLGNSDIHLAASPDGIEQERLILYNIPELQYAPYLSKITFRLYAWGATSVNGSFAIGRYAENNSSNSLAIGGTVVNPITWATDIYSFSGKKEGSQTILDWTTVSEQNCRGFDIMRSTDGILFSVIDFVPTKARGGFSTIALKYSYAVAPPSNNSDYYYRLCFWDNDNHNKLSKVILVRGNDPLKFTVNGVFPNPAMQQVNVSVDASHNDRIKLMISDITGKIVDQKITDAKKGTNIYPLDISEIQKGIYHIQVVSTNNGETRSIRFIKE